MTIQTPPEVPPLLVEYLIQVYPTRLPNTPDAAVVAHEVAQQVGIKKVIDHLAHLVEEQKEQDILNVHKEDAEG